MSITLRPYSIGHEKVNNNRTQLKQNNTSTSPAFGKTANLGLTGKTLPN